MLFDTNKQKGNTGLGMAISFFTSNGYIVSIPLNDTQDYDLIIDKDNKVERVQVKSYSCIDKKGKYQVALKSCGGTKGKTYKTFKDTNVEYLFIFLENMEMYLIPKEIIYNNSTITICEKYRKYEVHI